MRLPRVHLFEFEDQVWFPDILRRGLTDYLATITARTRPYAAALDPLFELVTSQRTQKIRDYCSGAGGPWPALLTDLTLRDPALQLELTDAFPNADALSQFGQGAPVTYRRTPLSPLDAWPDGEYVVTIFSGFHHFRPADARHILRHACDAQTPIAIFEVTHRSIAALAAMCIVPVALALLTPTIRPFRWWRILFTYVVPLLPLAAWWDGVVSCLRTYRPDELLALSSSVSDDSMRWSAGEMRTPGQLLPVTFLIGTPRRQVSAPDTSPGVTA